MKSFLFALQFLTTILIKDERIDEKNISKSIIYFPIIGFLIGLILAGGYNLLSFLNLEPLCISTILVILLTTITGGLHLDGLADTFDAFLSRKDRDEMLKIMRDPHIGAIGVLSLVSVILLKIVLLYSISTPFKVTALLLMCTLSRWSLVLSMSFFPYARTDGKAKIFIQNINFKVFSLASMVTLVLTILLWQLKGLSIFALIALSTYIIGKFINSKIGGITGDTLGAVNELTEAFVLFSICVFERFVLWTI